MNHARTCRWIFTVGAVLFLLKPDSLLGASLPPGVHPPPDTLGRVAGNHYLTPVGQLLTPVGQQVELPGMRPQALALSPDGKLLVAAGKANALIVIDTATGQVRQKVLPAARRSAVKTGTNTTMAAQTTTASENKNSPRPAGGSTNTVTRGGTNTNANTSSTSTTNMQLSFTGLIFSPNGKRLYLSTPGGMIKVFAVNSNQFITNFTTFSIPDANAPKQKREIPSGLAISAAADRLYVVGNLGNKLHELEAATGKALRSWSTGVAPYDVVLAAGKAYVSNMGGRLPVKEDLTAPAGRGTTVRVDALRHIANEGSVTVIDLASGQVKGEILVELHPSALATSPDLKYVVVANTGSDTLQVINTRTDLIVEKIWTRPPADLFGAQPNALAFHPNGKRLFVCNGTQNAVAVVEFNPEKKASKMLGLIPVGWFPAALQYNPARNQLCVANLKGIGAAKVFKPDEKIKLASKDYFGTVSLLSLPSKSKLAALTRTALQNLCYARLAESRLSPRLNQPARPVPERIGEPSVFKHVLYVIKENRTYDQVLGDMKEGNGNAQLCTFGEKYTPNQHKIAREFVLLDNTYCSGVQSADGHQWTDSAIVNAYLERQLTAEFPRSYPSAKTEDGLDALAWASSGFIWDNALAHGKTFRNYGEWMMSEAGWKDKTRKTRIGWRDFWKDYQTGTNQTRLASRAGIATLRPFSNTNTVGWDLNVPDVMRAAEFIRELRQFETLGGFPNFMILFLPNDHTGGTRGFSPTPAAQVADNDLAFGQVVEAVSHSKFWPETCIFAIEDDPQAGWDHVSGYRTTCYVVSPYTKRRQTIKTPYNQTSLLRTIELILGLPPMNQMDATASPMRDCFTQTANFTPFLSVTNRIPLDQFNLDPKQVANPVLRRDALLSAKLPLNEPDRCPEDVLNRILWRSIKGVNEPFPEWAVQAVSDSD